MHIIFLTQSIISFFIILTIWMLYKKNRNRLINIKKRLYQIPINQKRNESLISLYNCLDIDIPLKQFNGFVCAPDFLNEIIRKIFILKPRYVIELGSGVSTIIIGKALEKNGFGKLISLEHLKSEYDNTNEEIILHKLEEFCTCIFSPLSEIKLNNKKYNWYSIDFKKLETGIDMMIIDGPPIYSSKEASRYPALPLLKKYLNENFIILLDDANRNDEKKILDQWGELYPDITIESINLERGLAIIK